MPFMYDEINLIDGTYQPSMVHIHNTEAYHFWVRALYQRLCSVIKITTYPDNWQGSAKDFLQAILYRRGYLAVLDTPQYGKMFQPCSPGAYRNVLYQPTSVLINNPYANDISGEYFIGEDCEVLHLTPDWAGVWDIIAYHAAKLAQMDNAVDMAIINSKFAYMLAARDKAGREALKKGMDLINEGNPFVIFDTNIMKNKQDKEDSVIFLERKVKESYITTDLLNDFQKILDHFDRQVGIPTIPFEKKERLVTAETDRTDDQAKTWLNCLNSSNENITRFFGEKVFDFELAFDDEQDGGVENAGDIDTDRNA